MNNDLSIESPCIAVCTLNTANICSGCGRTIAEIGAWRNLSNAEKQAVLLSAGERRVTLAIQSASRS